MRSRLAFDLSLLGITLLQHACELTLQPCAPPSLTDQAVRPLQRHARNNTNASSFTYAERQMLKSGSKKERLGRDAMKVST